MAKSALKRRRGQRRGSRSCFSQRGWIQALLGGCALLVFGLAAGVIFGLMAFSNTGPDGGASPSLRNSKVFDINHIVANTVNNNNNNNNNNNESPAQQHDISLGTYTKATIKNKKQFLKHEMQLGNADGGFPYYPNDGALIEKDHDFSTFEAPGGNRFEEYMHGDSPYSLSISPNNNESDELARSRRYHVKKAMQHAYHGYEKYAFGMDELTPISKSGHNNWGGIGTTLVDSLDTLWLMDMKDEFYRARDWCKTSLDHDIHKKVSVFETTIRSLGGLLSAYDWSGDQAFLDQANDLGERLFKAFDTESGIPRGQVNLASGHSDNIAWTGSSAILSEFGTIQLEYRVLARLNGRKDYKDKVEKIFEIMDEMNPEDGLYPYFIRNTGDKPEFANKKITFGAMSDSFYEYMLKIWIQGGKTEPLYRKMYDKSIQGMHDELLSVSTPSGLVFIADKNSGTMDYKMDHLVCFMGGLLALGAYTDPQGLQSDRAQRDLKTAKALTYTCYQMYARMPTGISPEYIQFRKDNDFESGRGAPHYLLRPETVESFFVLYHLTGDPVYREWGWEVFQAIERYCKTDAGYGQLKDVRRVGRPAEDKMESFFLAETLKYIYLLFDPETPIDLLNKHVFNTEAHPVRTFPAMDKDGVIDLLK